MHFWKKTTLQLAATPQDIIPILILFYFKLIHIRILHTYSLDLDSCLISISLCMLHVFTAKNIV